MSAQKSPLFLSPEGGGNGIIASANIGRTILTGHYYKVMAQAGLGWLPKSVRSELPFSIPVQLTCNFGRQTYFFEAGTGATILSGVKPQLPMTM